jgi:hypothetical protein
MYNPNTSIFAGMSTAAVQTALNNAQQAYIALSTGTKVEVAVYAQGDGTKSVTYNKANLGDLVSLIKQLQAQLGVVHRARRPISFRYR